MTFPRDICRLRWLVCLRATNITLCARLNGSSVINLLSSALECVNLSTLTLQRICCLWHIYSSAAGNALSYLPQGLTACICLILCRQITRVRLCVEWQFAWFRERAAIIRKKGNGLCNLAQQPEALADLTLCPPALRLLPLRKRFPNRESAHLILVLYFRWWWYQRQINTFESRGGYASSSTSWKAFVCTPSGRLFWPYVRYEY